jgi:hypothetical protein
LAAAIVATVSYAVAASPLMNGSSPAEAVSAQISLLHRALIYAKEGSQKLVDGRWNLGQSESKLGVKLSDDEAKQLMACTGQIVCQTPDVHNEEEDRVGRKVTASAVSVLKPDMLVTAKHVLFDGKRPRVSFGTCSFRSYSNRKLAIPIVVEQDQRKGYIFNNEDFIVLRLKRALAGCNGFALSDSDASLPEGEQVLSVTGQQLRSLNKLSNREPVVAKGTIKRELDGVLGGPPFYYAELDVDDGGSGGGVFALKDGRPVADATGRLVLRGLLVAYGQRAKSGRPYSEDRNYTIIVGLQAELRDLIEGKALKPVVEPEPCPQGGTPKINVSSEPVPPPQPEALEPPPQQTSCRAAVPGRKSAKANAKTCTTRAKPAAARRVKEKRDYMLKNDTSCRICFTYNRCNGYGCWDEVVRLGAASSLSAGTREQAPVIKNPQFCK